MNTIQTTTVELAAVTATANGIVDQLRGVDYGIQHVDPTTGELQQHVLVTLFWNEGERPDPFHAVDITYGDQESATAEVYALGQRFQLYPIRIAADAWGYIHPVTGELYGVAVILDLDVPNTVASAQRIPAGTLVGFHDSDAEWKYGYVTRNDDDGTVRICTAPGRYFSASVATVVIV